jgi:hypothetical protein
LGKWIKSTHFNARISEAQMGKISGAAKRKKKKEREKALAEHIENLERLKLGPTKLWTGLVVHHKDIFAAHVLPKYVNRRIGISFRMRIVRVGVCLSTQG